MEILSRLGEVIQEFIVMVILTVAFAWMVSKLVAIVTDFQQGNLSITRAGMEETDLDLSAMDVDQLQPDTTAPLGEDDELDVSEARPLLQAGDDELLQAGEDGTLLTTRKRAEKVVVSARKEFSLAPPGEQAKISQQEGSSDVLAETPHGLLGTDLERASDRGADVATATSSCTETSNLGGDTTEKMRSGESLAVVEKKSPQKAIDKEDEEDWEGIEAGELEEEFDLAATFIASSMGTGIQASQDTQLLLYALYKQATVGQCIISQPSAFNLGAKAKWDAWKKLGKMDQEEAMARYIGTVSQIYPHWNSPPSTPAGTQAHGSSSLGTVTTGDSGQAGSREGSARGQSSDGHGLGPVFSSLVYAPDDTQPATKGLHDLHVHAKDGNLNDIKRLLEQGISPNETDGDGCTALHWAADRGHLDTVVALLAAGASINAQDGEGQTPLHYAITCEYKQIAEALVKGGADVSIPDRDGVTPATACPPSWSWKEITSSAQ